MPLTKEQIAQAAQERIEIGGGVGMFGLSCWRGGATWANEQNAAEIADHQSLCTDWANAAEIQRAEIAELAGTLKTALLLWEREFSDNAVPPMVTEWKNWIDSAAELLKKYDPK